MKYTKVVEIASLRPMLNLLIITFNKFKIKTVSSAKITKSGSNASLLKSPF